MTVYNSDDIIFLFIKKIFKLTLRLLINRNVLGNYSKVQWDKEESKIFYQKSFTWTYFEGLRQEFIEIVVMCEGKA